MTSFVLLLLVVTALGGSVGAVYGSDWNAEHSNSQIWKVSCGSSCRELESSLREHLDVLSHDSGSLSVLVRFGQLPKLKDIAGGSNQLQLEVENVAEYLRALHLLDVAHASTRASESCTADSCPAPLTAAYMTFQQIEWFLRELAKTYPKNVQLTSRGKSTEGRNLWLVKVEATGGTPAIANGKKRAVFVEGGTHAREWVAHSITLHILMSQVKTCAKNVNCNFTYYFMPMVNPDGYEYTWKTDRLWRKNRSTPKPGSTCYGIDLNRNYGYKYGGSGTSSDPCSERYRGEAPFTAPEAAAERDFLRSIASSSTLKFVTFISYHSFGQLVLYPWGYGPAQAAPYTSEMIKGGNAYAAALKSVSGFTYTVLNSAALYPAKGASDDYAKSLGVKYVYTVEVRDEGAQGFLVPASNIWATFNENLAGFSALMNVVNKNN